VNYLSVPGDVEKEWLSARLEATFVEWDGTLLEDAREEQVQVRVVAASQKESDDDDDDDDDSTIEGNDKNDEQVQEKEEGSWFQSITSMFQGQTESSSNTLGVLSRTTPDYGADSWKVDFKTLTIKVFGFQLFQQEFKEGTSRVWKMSYLDDDGTRIGKCCS